MRPNALFITDDRESYATGNYYLAYQRAFTRAANVTLAHPRDELPNLKRFDLVVLGHATIEHFDLASSTRFLPRSLQKLVGWRYSNLRALYRARKPTVLFTKNDYKQFHIKNAFIISVEPNLVITHTRSALQRLVAPPGGRAMWLPFGVDVEQFSAPETPANRRAFAVGFRANANTNWNEGSREQFFRALLRLERTWPVSLTLSQLGEGFLIGKAYADWMRSCDLLGNSVSAAGKVGPRFLEAMACGTVPLAPRHEYEGFLEADSHYVPVDAGPDRTFPDLEAAVERFFNDSTYRNLLRERGSKLAAAHTVDEHVLQVCRELGV